MRREHREVLRNAKPRVDLAAARRQWIEEKAAAQQQAQQQQRRRQQQEQQQKEAEDERRQQRLTQAEVPVEIFVPPTPLWAAARPASAAAAVAVPTTAATTAAVAGGGDGGGSFGRGGSSRFADDTPAVRPARAESAELSKLGARALGGTQAAAVARLRLPAAVAFEVPLSPRGS